MKLASGDDVDLKQFEPAMRHLLDTYIQADASRDGLRLRRPDLVELIVERGEDAVDELPEGIRDEPGGGGRDDREQHPQGDHRRVAGQPEVLREDVRAARRPDRGSAEARRSTTRAYLAKLVELAKKVQMARRGQLPGRDHIVPPSERSTTTWDKTKSSPLKLDEAIRSVKKDGLARQRVQGEGGQERNRRRSS